MGKMDSKSARTIREGEEVKKQSNFKEIMKRLRENKLAMAGGIVFVLLILIAILAPVIAPYDYLEVDLSNKYASISWQHLFGTDQYGRDIFSRVIWGGRWSITLGLVSALMALAGGVVVGIIAGFFGGKVDYWIMRLIDVVQSIPSILMQIIIAVILGSGLWHTCFALAFGGIWGGARMLRAQILTVREQEYVEAAKATDVSRLRMIIRYVLPNSIQPLIISTCMSIGGMIMGASGLSFLGIGIQPPLPEWGAMLNDSRTSMRYYPNTMLAPLLFISLTVLSVSLFGDGIRDAMDPRLKESASTLKLEKEMLRAQKKSGAAVSGPLFIRPDKEAMSGKDNAWLEREDRTRFKKGEDLLQVRNLSVAYISGEKVVRAVNNVSFELKRGESLALVGESGCGKSTIANAIMRILPDTGAGITGGEILFRGRDIVRLPEKDMLKVRGAKISMVFQDPMTALNPVSRIINQIAGVIKLHNEGMSKKEAVERGTEMLRQVGITKDRVRDYPHQFSGGMQQRVVVAIGLSCNPELLLADEPTTALDVTIQAQVLKMMKNLITERNTAMLLITHNLGIVAETCDNVAVLYGGEIVEYGSCDEIFENPSHPYTIGLLNALPDIAGEADRLTPIEGIMPEPSELPEGCKFHTRCAFATEKCKSGMVPVVELGGTHRCQCHHLTTVRASMSGKEAKA